MMTPIRQVTRSVDLSQISTEELLVSSFIENLRNAQFKSGRNPNTSAGPSASGKSPSRETPTRTVISQSCYSDLWKLLFLLDIHFSSKV